MAQRGAELVEELPLRSGIRRQSIEGQHVVQVDLARFEPEARTQEIAQPGLLWRGRHEHPGDGNGTELALEMVEGALDLHGHALERAAVLPGGFSGDLPQAEVQAPGEVE